MNMDGNVYSLINECTEDVRYILEILDPEILNPLYKFHNKLSRSFWGRTWVKLWLDYIFNFIWP